MEGNPASDDADVGSNDGDNMPELEASVEPEIDQDDEEQEQIEEEEEDNEEELDEEMTVGMEDEDDEGPILETIEPEEDEDDEGVEDIEEAVDEEEEEEEEVDQEMAQVVGEDEEEEEEEGKEIQEEFEQDVEGEDEEEEEEEQCEGNPGGPIDENSSDQNEEENTDEVPDSLRVKDQGGRKRTASISSADDGPRRKHGRSSGSVSGETHEEKGGGAGASISLDGTHDRYCWVCHKDGVYFNCKICPRSYHMRCICLPDYPEPTLPEGDGTSKVCICPECVVVMNAEEVDKRSDAMKQLSMDQLVGMLKQICGRMKVTPGAEPFLKPVQASDACDYFEYIVYPMDIQTLEKNVKQRQYGSTEAFLADAQWIVHNSIIFNSSASPYTASAKRILKVCKQELAEIETCPECYTNAHTKSDTWFVEACKRPHILVWAKLKGFPFWPAKAMKIKDDQVDVRFFGQHDRAWVNLKDCFLYSEEMPAAPPKKNVALLSAIEELNTHIGKLGEVYGEVLLAKVKTPLGRELSTSEIQRLLPDFKPENQTAKPEIKTTPKSGITITISSVKTNPTIVNNSVTESPPASTTPEKTKASTKSKRGSISTSAETTPTRTTRSAKAVTAVTTTTVAPPEVEASEPESAAETPTEPPPEPPPASESPPSASSSPPQPPSEPTKAPTPPPTKSPQQVSTAPPPASKPVAPTKPQTSPASKSQTPTVPSSKPEEAAKEKEQKDLDDDFDSRVPSGEILANALGLKRIVRRPSQTEAKKPETPVLTDSSDTSGLSEHLQQQLKKVSRISVTAVDPLEEVKIKTEPVDRPDDPEDSMELDEQPERVSIGRSKAQDFMEHISTQAQTKPGYRFNISKDISISAIGQDSEPEDTTNNNNTTTTKPKKTFSLGSSVTVNVQRPLVSVQPTKQTPPGPSLVTQRPKLAQALQQQQPTQRFLAANKDIRSLTRMLKPAMSPPTSSKSPVPTAGPVRTPRAVPGAIQMSSLRGGSILQKIAKDSSLKQPIVVDSTSLRVDSPNQYTLNTSLSKVSSLQVSQVQPGAITLPGGTITVTPLSLQGSNGSNTTTTTANFNNTSSINGERLNVPLKPGGNPTTSTYSNGFPVSKSVATLKATKASNIGSAAARKVTNMVPPTVVQTVQNLQKNVNEMIRVAAEQIAVDMVEHAAVSASKSSADGDKNYKLENEKLLMKHTKELTELRLNHEIMMRELRSNMETEKKRALMEMRRQMELEKQKAVDEAKRKQWCAHCLREALFYCCWNTSYCGYSCQENHWPTHMATCTQNSGGGSGGVETGTSR